MSMFGTLFPKFIANPFTTRDEILLNYAVVLKDEPDPRNYNVEAVRTGKRVFTNEGKHWIFQVKIYLWKYADPETKYLELKGFEGTEVELFRHSDGEPFYSTNGLVCPFNLISVNESYTDPHNKYDVLILTFLSSASASNELVNPIDIDASYLMDAVESGGTADNSYWKNLFALGTDNELTKSFLRGSANFYLTVNGHEARRIYVFNAFPGTDFAFGTTTTEIQALRTGNDFTIIISFCRHTYPALSDAGRRGLFEMLTSDGNYFRIYNAEQLSATMGDGSNEVSVITAGTYADVGGGDTEFYTVAVVFDQTNKRINLYTNLGEDLSDTNASYVSSPLSNGSSGWPKIGTVTGITGAYAGAVGDIIFFNQALNKTVINYYARRQTGRLAIDWSQQ